MTTEELGKLADEYASSYNEDATAYKIGLMRGFIDGYHNGQCNPEIKKLEWLVEFHIGDKEVEIKGETAKTNIGSYEFFEQDGKFLLYTIVGCLFEFETKELAKEFAQKDFEQMVMGCIETKNE